MAQLAVWMVVCVAVALSFQKRPVFVLSAILVLRILVPSSAGWVIIGDWSGNAAIHPATLLLLTWAPFYAMSRFRAVVAELRRHPVVHAFISLAVVLFVVIAVLRGGPTSLIGLTNSVLAGILFFFMLRTTDLAEPGSVARILRVLIGVMVAESLLVLVQWGTDSLLPWGAIVEFPLATRALGTFDSPLDLGLAAALTIPLLANVRRALPRYVAAALLLAAVALSESRTPTIFAALGLAYLILSAMKSVRSFIAMLVVLGAGAAIFVNIPILSGLAERFTGDDGNSAAARSVATDYILQNIGSVLVYGNGWGSSYRLKGTLLETSLENGYAILAFDLGGMAVLGLLFGQLLMVFSRRGVPGAWLAAVFAIAGGFTYSGITTMSAISIVIWAVFASRITPPAPTPEATVPWRQESAQAAPERVALVPRRAQY